MLWGWGCHAMWVRGGVMLWGWGCHVQRGQGNIVISHIVGVWVIAEVGILTGGRCSSAGD